MHVVAVESVLAGYKAAEIGFGFLLILASGLLFRYRDRVERQFQAVFGDDRKPFGHPWFGPVLWATGGVILICAGVWG